MSETKADARAPTDPYFVPTKYGWRVVLLDELGNFDAGDEVEAVTKAGERKRVILVRMSFARNGKQWWSFQHGQRAKLHIQPPPRPLPPPEDKAAQSPLDDDDVDRVSTGAGAAYLGARRRAR